MNAPLTERRLSSLDAYRGLAMFLMVAEVMHLCSVAKHFPNSSFWGFLCHHQSHVPWTGCSLHDMIQPSFSFIVGVALPFSIAARMEKGQSQTRLTVHAFWRALILASLGIFLRSQGRSATNFTFDDTLTQIGFGYGFLFMLGFRSVRFQWIAFGVILVGYWLAFVLYPAPGADFDYAAVGVKPDWEHLREGFESHWNKNSNLAYAFDVWWMNLFPRTSEFTHSGGGYQTLSFIPTLATMLLGLLAGGVLRSERNGMKKVYWLAIAGVVGLVAGYILQLLGICPIVKRIWTPSWVLFSGGWCLLALSVLYWVIDVIGFRAWSFPLRVIGLNSIAIYCMSWTIKGWVSENLRTHLGDEVFGVFGESYEPMLGGAAVVIVFWLILFWMYRRKIFLRI